MTANTAPGSVPAVAGATGTQSNSNVPASATAQNSDGQVSSVTTINNLGDLKAKAPKVYKAMMQGIAMSICNEMQQSQQRVNQMIQENTPSPYG